ncbi:MAG: type I 3-dehydroquinate dehydratase [Methanocellales archaeon]|nr:type I 3-dehydroquinate dehydratase [Methanocellales archaeon]MDD4898804.1 type I 3-dehydroquinate dehydratase [Methanocellales archaeon]MDD5446618.1 type I 3-dehydroquinate dehydratase [Methanocellales archaeon]
MRIGDVELDTPKIVGVINSIDEVDTAEKTGADLLEIRMDLLDEKEDVVRFFEDVTDATSLPIIATDRLKSEGGSFVGSENQRISMLMSVMEYADAVDIELRSAEKDFVIEKARKRKMVAIVSYHDFAGTPSKEKMLRILKEARQIGDIPKLAVMANSLSDVISLLEVTLQAQKPFCTIAMGSLGKHSRVIAPLYGSALTYGHVVGEGKAPGQLSVGELRNVLDALVG